MLADWIGPHGHIVATDFSEVSLKENAKSLPQELRTRVSFVKGDIHDDKLLDSSTHHLFDYITCRQGTLSFSDPITVFRNWFKWLKPGGQVIILDGLRTRRMWDTGPGWGDVVDDLPLSCLQTMATIPYLLQHSGFMVDHCRLLERVNQIFASKETQLFECPRYIVVAHKPQL